MRLAVIVAAVASCAASAAAPAAAQDRPPAFTNAEACLRAHVAEAVRVSSGATDAAEFLLGYLCAETVAYAVAYERNSTILTGFLAMGDAAASFPDSFEDDEGATVEIAPEPNPFLGMSVDAVTGEFHIEDDTGGNALTPVLTSMTGMQAWMANDRPPAFLRALAGELVMQHRR